MTPDELDEAIEAIWGPEPDPKDVPPEHVWVRTPIRECKPGYFIKLEEPDISLGSGFLLDEPYTDDYGEMTSFHVKRQVQLWPGDHVLVARWPNGELWPNGDWR